MLFPLDFEPLDCSYLISSELFYCNCGTEKIFIKKAKNLKTEHSLKINSMTSEAADLLIKHIIVPEEQYSCLSIIPEK